MNTVPTPSIRSARGGALKVLLVALAAIVVLLSLAWALFLPSIVAGVVSSRTGFGISADKISVNPFTGTVHLVALEVKNPATFPKPDFVALRELKAEVALGSLFSDKLVIESAKVDLESLSLIRAIDGTLNAKLFADRLQGEPGEPPEPKATPAPANRKTFLIKHLELRVGRLRTESHSGRTPVAREFNLGFAQTYTNVTDVKQLVSGPVMKSFTAAGVALGNLLPSDWARLLEGGTKETKNFLKDLGRAAKDALQSTTGTLEESRKP